MQRYNFIFIYKLFTSLFYHSHIISPQKPHLSLSNPLFSNILIFVLSLSYFCLISTLSPPYLRLISALSPPYLLLISTLSPPYLHLIFVHSSFILRSFFVHSSFILRPFFVHSSFILRSFFVHSSFILRSFFVQSSFILRSFLIDRATCICPCGSHLPVWLTLFRHTPPSAYGLRPITSSSFFRLETSFLTFLALLYHSMSQLLIYPFYNNRPRFV